MNIGLYTTTALFIISEILPFIPKTGNGFLHSIFEIIKNILEFINKNKIEVDKKIENKIDKSSEENEILFEKDTNKIEELKKRLEDLNKELEKYKYLENV